MTKRIRIATAVLLTALALPVQTLAQALPPQQPRHVEVIAASGGGSWRVMATGSLTVVERRDGPSPWSTRIAGRFVLPVVTSRGLRAGPSLDGASLVLSAAPVRTATSSPTRFVIVSSEHTYRLELPGQWAFDAVSPDGATVFLTESVGRGQYWVRSVDVATGVIGERLVTKDISYDALTGGSDGPMEGLPLDRLMSPDELTAFTLYDGPSHPFVHALDTAHGGALCYELPAALKPVSTKLSLRQGKQAGLVDVLNGGRVVAQVADPTSVWGPAVRIPGTDRAPVGA